MSIDHKKFLDVYTTLSIVSHGQGSLISRLLSDIDRLQIKNFEVIITINIPEDESPYENRLFPLKIIRNATPKGFGSNHNSAFKISRGDWFCVVNPDVRILSLNLENLLQPFCHADVAAIAPLVLSPEGKIEDSARRFPTFLRYFKRVILRQRSSDFIVQTSSYPVDWVAGMFVVFRRDAYMKVGGFDDRRFFMYLEDADICRRIWANGWQVIVNPTVEIIHEAQRASYRNLRHMRWHFVSAFRFLTGM